MRAVCAEACFQQSLFTSLTFHAACCPRNAFLRILPSTLSSFASHGTPLTLSSPHLSPPCSHYQALEVIRELSKTIPIERAHMRVRLVCDKKVGKELKAKVAPLLAKIEEEDWGASYDLVSCWAPRLFLFFPFFFFSLALSSCPSWLR